MIFRQFFDSQSSTFTYLLGDETSKEAILIDPVYEQISRDLQFVGELGLQLTLVLNTHCHADHVTGTGGIKKQIPTVKSGISKEAGAKADLMLQDGMILKFGKYEIKCISTPGHTNGCISYYIEKTGTGTGIVLTGDTLLIRGTQMINLACGRTDFQEGSSERLYDNVHQKLFTLPESTLVYPGHDYKGRTVSSIKEEKTFNPRLTKTKTEFVDLMNNLGLADPKMIDIAVPANLNCGLDYVPAAKV